MLNEVKHLAADRSVSEEMFRFAQHDNAPAMCPLVERLRLGRSSAQRAAQPAEQHIIWRLVLGVELEARALEPLHQHRLALDRLLLRLADRHAKQRQALGVAAAAPAIELQPVALPVGGERATQAV